MHDHTYLYTILLKEIHLFTNLLLIFLFFFSCPTLHSPACFEFVQSELFRSTSAPLKTHYPPVDGPVSEYGITFQTHIVDKFGVSFGREGETMSLGCTVVISPVLQGYKPGIEWYRDGKQPLAIVLV